MISCKICGIYKIINKVNGKIYIGQSRNINKRWKEHRRQLNKNYGKENDHLQNAWDKYGEDKFKFEIIEECEIEQLNEREVYWITFYKSLDRNYGYNKTSGGSQNKILSNETKEKLRQANIGIHRGENSERAKYSKEQIRHVKMLLYCNMCFKDINEITQVPIEYISKIKNLDKWKYELWELNEYIKSLKISSNHAIPIIMFDIKLNKIKEFKSGKEASKKTGLNESNINACVNFKTLTCGNHVWLKADEDLDKNIKLKRKELETVKTYVIHRIDDCDNIIETFNSIVEICNKYNLDSGAVSKVCSGQHKQTKGYRFKKELIKD